jgi:hypothetical protein
MITADKTKVIEEQVAALMQLHLDTDLPKAEASSRVAEISQKLG